LNGHRGVAQLGSAVAWGAKGRRFKSCRPDHLFESDSKVRLGFLLCFFPPQCFDILTGIFALSAFFPSWEKALPQVFQKSKKSPKYSKN
jgi:hypothetical protein